MQSKHVLIDHKIMALKYSHLPSEIGAVSEKEKKKSHLSEMVTDLQSS